jgi:hypothetical protein
MGPVTVLSSDAHVFEPPDLWTTRIDAAFRDRAPRMERARVLPESDDSLHEHYNIQACSGKTSQARAERGRLGLQALLTFHRLCFIGHMP